MNPDVDPEEMKKSDSKDKYVYCYCFRETIQLTLDSNESSSESEISDQSSKISFEQGVAPMESSNVNLTASQDENLDPPSEIFFGQINDSNIHPILSQDEELDNLLEILAEETAEVPMETSNSRKRKLP